MNKSSISVIIFVVAAMDKMPGIMDRLFSWFELIAGKDEYKMMIFDDSLKWYKGNLHTHTTLSDGTADVEQCVGIYKKEGYDFLAITDHNKYHHGFYKDAFLVLSGIEFDLNDHKKKKAFHIVGIGMSEEICAQQDMSA